MNDDRKFQERAEIVKQLLLARIPTDIVAKVAGISDATVTNDRIRVAKLYGIKVPNASSTSLEREERFRMLLKTYLTVKFETREWENPIYQAARLTIDFDRIDNHFSSLGSFWEGLQNPLFLSDDPIAKNYQHLIKDCYSTEYHNFSSRFYKAIYDGIIPYDKISNEDDIINLATEFCCKIDRSCLNTMVIKDPKSIVEGLFASLTERQITVLRCWYGLDGEKMTLSDIGEDLMLTRERVRQIREKSLGIIRNKLEENKYLIHSTDRYNHLEQQYAKLDEKYKNYCNDTDKEILELHCTIQKLKNIHEEHDESLDDLNNYPLRIQILIMPIKEVRFSKRIYNALHYDYEYILDIIENWDKLLKCRNLGKKSFREIEDFLEYYDINRKTLPMEEKVLARRIIKRLKESQT